MECSRAAGGERRMECRDRKGYEAERGGRGEEEWQEAEADREINIENNLIHSMGGCMRVCALLSIPRRRKGHALVSLSSLALHTPSRQLSTLPALLPPFVRP